MLKLSHVTVRYGGRAVVNDVSFSLEAGQWLMLAGPNGAGKSTLLRAVSRGTPWTGEISLEGRDVRAFSAAGLARKIGFLSQRHPLEYAYTVEEIVSLGRYAHRGGPFSGGDSEGPRKIEEALALTGMTALRRAPANTLSGGELQRAFLAQVLAQDPSLLMLDEPANHLDPLYQQQIFSLIGEWLRQPGRAVLSVVHDLSLARRFGTHAVLLDQGRVAAKGTVSGTFTPENLRRVYGMDVYAWMDSLLRQWEAPYGA